MILTRKPLIVLDWSVIRALSPSQSALPNRFFYVLPDAAFIEILTAEPVDSFATKLEKVLRANVSNFAVAHHWHELWRQERTPFQCIPRLALLDRERTDAVDSLIKSRDTPLQHVLESHAFAAAKSDHDKRRAISVKFCQQFATNAHKRFPKWQALTSDELEFQRLARLSNPIYEIASFTDPSTDTDRWQKALSLFPDRHALARWSRLVVWYAMLNASNHTYRFENNWDDSFYVFTASYCDGMVSLDKGLRRCVRCLFPNCRVYDSFEALMEGA